MIRLNGFDFYLLGAFLRPLSSLNHERTVRELEPVLGPAMQALDFILTPGRFVPDLQISRDEGIALIEAIRGLVARTADHTSEELFDLPIGIQKQQAIKALAEVYERVLSADLRSQSLFLVPPRGAYSSDTLIANGETLVPSDVVPWLPHEAVADLREAGRCLAFSVPTAAGFHFLRATEAVIKRYYSLIACRPEPTGKMRNWGRYVELLSKAGGDKRAVKLIDQVRELYRNPVVHPETVLTANDALGLFAMCVGILVAIAADAQRRAR